MKETFGEAVRRRRKALGLSQWQLANAVRLAQPVVSQIEIGYVEPSALRRERIERALDTFEAQRESVLRVTNAEPRLRRGQR